MKFLALVLFALLIACKTQETLFTPAKLCEKLKVKANATERDEYDNCLIRETDLLRDPQYCKDKCKSHCEWQEINYAGVAIDVAGCHCECTVK